MPPVYEPLRLNCDLLFALADKLNISESEKLNIEGILHHKGEPIFLTIPLDAKYWFIREEKEEEIAIDYVGTAMILPVAYLSGDAGITVTINDKDWEEPVVLTDWRIDKVERGTEGKIATYQVAYVSDSAHNHNWIPDEEISIDIVPKAEAELTPYHFEFRTEGTKREWYDYLKVWEGHKNNWYDYAKVWENSVVFVQVK